MKTPVRPRGLRLSSVALLAALLGASAAAPPARGEPGESEFAATLLMDAETGEILVERNAHLQRPPASMVKMMVMLLAMEAVEHGAVSLDDPVTVSAWASRIGGSQVYLKEAEVFPLRDLLRAVVIASANDAAVAVAEHIGGTTEAFIESMNARAARLGLRQTVYRSVHGLPPGRGQEFDVSSAHDLAQLARVVIRYEDIRTWASTPVSSFRDGKFQLTNTNRLVGRYAGVTGLKTGYHAKAGFGVTATATRGDLSLVAVVLGSRRRPACFDEAARLLTYGFSNYRVVRAARKGRAVGTPIPVAGGELSEIHALAAADLRLLVRRSGTGGPQVEARLPALVEAPVTKGQRLGEVVVTSGDQVVGRVDLVASHGTRATGWLGWYRNWQASE
jgi:D-alanyl-D-alanine carboxypeptidase (penicillin-binding protein 5/6)